MHSILKLLVLSSTCATGVAVFAKEPTVNKLSQAAATRIEKAAETMISRDALPGFEMAVVYKGETVYECGYGAKDLKLQAVPGPDTAYQIDSVTKAFTAMAVLKLIEDGKVKLDDPISKYLSLSNDNWKPIAVKQLLSMTSGIPTGGTKEGNYKEVVDRIASRPAGIGNGLAFEPGTKYMYSNVNFMLLGEIIEEVTGQPYNNYVKSTILDPLGMDHTGLIPFDDLRDHATPYIQGEPVPARDPMSGFSAGGLTSTVHDLEKFAAGLQRRAVLKAESYKAMWTPATLENGPAISWGLGWEIRDAETNRYATVYAKNGGGYGWSAQFNYYASKDVAVIVVANSAAKGIAGLCLAAAKAVTGG